SWEVCNKVGGIYTVISTKANTLVNELGNNYILIGPDVYRDGAFNPEFEEDKKLFKLWKDKAFEEGLRIRVGHWKIKGYPIAILVDFTPFFSQKDQILSQFWETYRLDSITGQWDYVEPCLFGYAAGKIIESFLKFNLSIRDKVVAQFHEWMTGSGLLYLKMNTPQVATVFTTHATVLGRAIAGNHQPLYSQLKNYNPDAKAAEFNVIAKYSLEKIAAQQADSFTTVSEITNQECEAFLQKPADVITPNGFENAFVPDETIFDQERAKARQKLKEVAQAIHHVPVNDNDLFIAISGRYEFHNKGIDVFIDSLAQLNNNPNLNKTIYAFILVPAGHYGPRKDLTSPSNLSSPCQTCVLTHNLHFPEHDSILQNLQHHNLIPSVNTKNKVHVIYAPSYLNGDDGIFNLTYYQLLIGFDLTVFPSYYEPWGYTPLESIAFKVPTITTTLAGFGLWVEKQIGKVAHSVTVIDRTDNNQQEVVEAIANEVLEFSKLNHEEVEIARNNAYQISLKALWSNLIFAYYSAFQKAIEKATQRSGILVETEKAETLSPVEKLCNANLPTWKRLLVQKHIPEKLHALEEISKNLWWSWNYEAVDLFQSIDPKLWQLSEENPIVFLDNLPYEKFLELEKDATFLQKLETIYGKFLNYMQQPMKQGPKVAYFSMEFGLHDSLKIYSGGLGILAGDYLKEASDSRCNIIGVGLLYRYGYFKQVISEHGDQIAQYESQTFSKTCAQPVRDANNHWVTIHINLPGRTVNARIWKVQVGRVPLYLLDTDYEDNTPLDRSITHNLYGGDWDNRMRQEILLGIGGIRALDAMGIECDIYHCNEGHAAFIGLERLRKYIMKENLTFGEAMEIVRSSQLFTTHTPVPAGHDAFTEDMMRTYLGHYPQRLKISWRQFMALGKANPDDPAEKFSMSFLAANLSQEINAVSKLHSQVSKDIFHALYKGYSPEELHLGYVTNGVHLPTWTARPWMQIYEETFGSEFFTQQTQFDTWSKIHAVPDSVIWKIRNSLRLTLIEYIKEQLKDASARRVENPKMAFEIAERLNKHTLTIGFARRFATYKRAYLLFSDLDRLARIVNNPTMPVQFLFAGKAHPNDKAGQDLIKRIVEISKRPEFIGKIVFLPNYEMKLAKMLVQGVDVWLNTPTRPLEASGTSGEKAVMNGVLHFSVLDGWWVEGYKEGAGWALPQEITYENPAYQDQLDAETIYSIIENEIAPLFYYRNEEGIPTAWINYIKNSIEKIASRFTMSRQLEDYIKQYYEPLSERNLRMKANDYELAKELARWKKKVRTSWESIDVVEIKHPDVSKEAVELGSSYSAEITLDLNELSPEDIGIEVVLAEPQINDRPPKIVLTQEFKLVKSDSNLAYYKTEIVPKKAGAYEMGIRIFPKHPDLPHRQDFNYIRWI
ncbi:MAG: alpha-glucan family phosphorylase, partial [Bacteroidales bacterium]|nr:alpha-glucan family phosphorylase [Bacteroidales bacterium]